MARRAFFPDELADLQVAQTPDHPRAEHQRDHQGRNTGQCCPNSDVAEHIQRVKITQEHVIEKIEQHLSRAPYWGHAWRQWIQDSFARNARPALPRSAPSSPRANLSPEAS